MTNSHFGLSYRTLKSHSHAELPRGGSGGDSGACQETLSSNMFYFMRQSQIEVTRKTTRNCLKLGPAPLAMSCYTNIACCAVL